MPESRADLEARLKAASDSMSRRLSAMEDEVRLPGLPVLKEVLPQGKAQKVGVAVGIGLVVGLIAGGIGSGRRKGSKGRDAWLDDIADAVGRRLREGDSPADAIRRVVDRKPPPDRDGDGFMGFVLGYAIRQVAGVAVREIVNRLASRNGEDSSS